MGLHIVKRLKLDKSLGLNSMSAVSRPIKVTNLADETINGDQKAIENAKTGKVTAVVAVMYLNWKSKIIHKKRDTNRHGTAIGAQQDTNSLQNSEILIGMKRPLEHSKRLIVPKRLSGFSSTLGRVGTSFS